MRLFRNFNFTQENRAPKSKSEGRNFLLGKVDFPQLIEFFTIKNGPCGQREKI